MTHPLTRLDPPSLPDAAALGYAQITTVEPGRMAYVSGQVGLPADGTEPPEGLAAQTRIATANCAAALEALGAGPSDIAMMRIYVVGLDDAAMSESFPLVLEFLAGTRPALTGIGVSALAVPGLRIEIEMIVRLPG